MAVPGGEGKMREERWRDKGEEATKTNSAPFTVLTRGQPGGGPFTPSSHQS